MKDCDAVETVCNILLENGFSDQEIDYFRKSLDLENPDFNILKRCKCKLFHKKQESLKQLESLDYFIYKYLN